MLYNWKKVIIAAVLCVGLIMPGTAWAAEVNPDSLESDTVSESVVPESEIESVFELESEPEEMETEAESEITSDEPEYPEYPGEQEEKEGLVEESEGIYYYENGERFVDGFKAVEDENGNVNYYYFQKDGTAYTKGLLEYKNDSGQTCYSYFQTSGQAYTGGYKPTSTQAYVNDNGDIISTGNGTTYYYYFQKNGQAYKKGLLEFVNTNGKTYYFYFQSNGQAYTDGYKPTATLAHADADGNISQIGDGTTSYYYFQKNGQAYTKGLLEFSNTYGTHYFYFQSNGQAYTGGYKPTGTQARVNEDGNIVNISDGTTHYYYFQKNGQAYKKGLLEFVNTNDKTYYFYFQSNGQAFTTGYKPTKTKAYVGDDGKIVDTSDGTTRYFYFQTNGQAYTHGLLEFVNTNGKTYYFYFQSNGQAYTDGYKPTSTQAVIGSDGKVRDKRDGSVFYYYFNTNGQAYTGGWKTINSQKYYFQKNGQAILGWKSFDGDWYYFAENSGVQKFKSNVLHSAWKKAQDMSSETDYIIIVDISNTRTMIFKGSKGNWVPVYNWICTPGKPSTPTVKGTFKVQNKGYKFGSGYTCYYYTQFYNDYLFHSIIYDENTFNVQDGRLGYQLSHGCVRLALENAKWIYDNIPRSTKVHIY